MGLRTTSIRVLLGSGEFTITLLTRRKPDLAPDARKLTVRDGEITDVSFTVAK